MAIPRFWAWIWMATLAFCTVAKAELVLTNFSAANPLKVMAIGDSITDDCSFSGAWRLYLQPLLETNGFPFTFVGRQSSSGSGKFTKTKHEGYCGSVIAAPGVMTSSVHGYPGSELYLHKIIRDALTNATPDLVLILMGANDIGRGRDPWRVATNDMPQLLDLIFSNAPNVNIILTKTTTLQDAAVSGLATNYGAFATNVPIYNLALEAMIKARRDAGQNVFLADMYSAVNYFTMFLGDHLHPNALGLQAIAAEWLTRIESITRRTNKVSSLLIHGGETWNYFDGGVDLGTNWVRPDYDDTGWGVGPARFGYNDFAAATQLSYGPVATNKYPTTYFRHAFVAPSNVVFTNLTLRLAQAHGSVVWLNGHEVWRTNLPAAGSIAYTNFATRLVTTYSQYIYNPIKIDPTNLVAGTNVIAVEVHQFTRYNDTLGFDLELMSTGYPYPPPALSASRADTHLVLSWPANFGAGFSLFQNTNLGTPNWTPAGSALQTNGGQVTTTQSIGGDTMFYRLQKP